MANRTSKYKIILFVDGGKENVAEHWDCERSCVKVGSWKWDYGNAEEEGQHEIKTPEN